MILWAFCFKKHHGRGLADEWEGAVELRLEDLLDRSCGVLRGQARGEWGGASTQESYSVARTRVTSPKEC